jgi:hypothetical protein
MDQRLVERITALNDPDLNEALQDHGRLHGELDALQTALWLDEDQKRQLHRLKRAKLSQKDKLLRLLSDREAAMGLAKGGQR